MRKLLLSLLTISCLLLTPSSTHASPEFYSSNTTTYRFDATGQATIDQKVSLRNKYSNIYATRYQFRIQGDTPTHITAHDSLGPLRVTTNQESPDITRITVEFNDHVIGKDNILSFTLQYQGKPAIKNGQVWEIVLPKLGSPEAIDSYHLNLIIPESFGKPAFISPNPTTSQGQIYTFTKDQLTKIGVVAAFGNFQAYSFTLKYHLQNTTNRPGLATLPLPPDTNYQRVFYDSLAPQPETVSIDPDGNWLATYHLKPQQSIDITATGQAHLLSEPTTPLTEISPQELQTYLAATPNWPADEPQIKSLAASLATPQKIYDYVVSHLDYDYSQLQTENRRKGGKLALENPKSSLCGDFTDAFITLARAAGIPAREINGYAHTTDPNLRPLSLVANTLHAWPQYWDTTAHTWISVDPTWSKTTGGIDYFHKLDFNHFTFVIHGKNDSSPPPTFKSVQVDFAPYKEYPANPPTITWKPPFQLSPFSPTTTHLTISNPQGQALYHPHPEIPVIPPLGQVSLPITLARQSLLDFTPKSFSVAISGQTMSYNIPQTSLLLWQITFCVLISSIIITLGFIAAKAWRLYLQRPKRPNPLRW